MGDPSSEVELDPALAAPQSAGAPAKRRPSIKELVQTYGGLAAGIYLTTSLLGFLIAFALITSAVDLTSWGLPAAEGQGWWAAAIAAWIVGVKGSQIPRIMLTAALTPVVAHKLGRGPRLAEPEAEPGEAEQAA